jgi:putative aldouronate transport system permease protein
MIFQMSMILLFSLLFMACFYPFWYIFIISISDSVAAQRTIITVFPIQVTLDNYRQIFNLQGIYSSFVVSTARTIVGTAVTLLFTSIFAYTLTKQSFQ